MTTLQLHTEIHRALTDLADSESYLQKALHALQSLAKQKMRETKETPPKKLRVDRSRPLPTDKYVGFVSAPHKEDEQALADYMADKYLI